jgi:hypothetical protein
MDLSKLSSNEKMAVYSSVVLVLAGIISNWGGLMWLSVLAGVAVLAVVLLPQISPSTKLPGSKGSLLVALGGIAAAGAVIEFLRFISYFFNTLDDYRTWLFAIAAIAAVYLLWLGWKAFQAEGGKFVMGMSAGASVPPVPMVPPPAPPMAEPMAPPMAEPMAPPMAEPMAGSMDEPMADERPEDDQQR